MTNYGALGNTIFAKQKQEIKTKQNNRNQYDIKISQAFSLLVNAFAIVNS